MVYVVLLSIGYMVRRSLSKAGSRHHDDAKSTWGKAQTAVARLASQQSVRSDPTNRSEITVGRTSIPCPAERVMYDLSEWAKAPALLITGRRSVRLDGFSRQPANTLEVLVVGRERLLLLVVPSSTDPDIAHEAMMTAAAPDNASTVDDMLGISDGAKEPPNASEYMRFGDVYVEHNDATLDVFPDTWV